MGLPHIICISIVTPYSKLCSTFRPGLTHNVYTVRHASTQQV